jgi:hypothetical protein
VGIARLHSDNSVFPGHGTDESVLRSDNSEQSTQVNELSLRAGQTEGTAGGVYRNAAPALTCTSRQSAAWLYHP